LVDEYVGIIALPSYLDIKDSDIMEEFVENISNENKKRQNVYKM